MEICAERGELGNADAAGNPFIESRGSRCVETAVNHNIAFGSSFGVHFEKRQGIGFIRNLKFFHYGMFARKKVLKVGKEKLADFVQIAHIYVDKTVQLEVKGRVVIQIIHARKQDNKP